MKNAIRNILILSVVSISGSAFAQGPTTQILQCFSRAEFGPADVRIVLQNGRPFVTVEMEQLDDSQTGEPRVYHVGVGAKDVSRISRESATVVASLAGTETRESGVATNALMLRILEGRRTAYLALAGDVYVLNCK